jgi:hypothetical protein
VAIEVAVDDGWDFMVSDISPFGGECKAGGRCVPPSGRCRKAIQRAAMEITKGS